METVLMMVTVVALGLAIGMSALAWRLLRDNRQRSTARVEALQSMAADTEAPARFASLEEDEQDTEVSGWDLEFEPEPVVPVKPAPRRAPRAAPRASSRRPAPELTFGATVAVRSGAPPRRWLALAVVGLVMAAVVSTVYAVYRPVIAAESTTTADAADGSVIRVGSSAKPLELLSLHHSVAADGAFTVTGLVQNPANGQASKKVMAVVYLFDRDGNYFASGKAALDFSVLQPGEESPFVVHVPNVGRVGRYRVGFRSDDGGNIAHVDRRGQLPGGTTGDALDAPSATHAATQKRAEGRP
jgi:hypothetical protein